MEDRNEDRAPVGLSALLRSRTGATFAATITDISPRGCRASMDKGLNLGTFVNVTAEGLAAEGWVGWSHTREVGIVFAEALPEETLARIGAGMRRDSN
jgi:hypothetical protein